MVERKLHLVSDYAEEEHSLGTMLIRNTVNLVVARTWIRTNRTILLGHARACREVIEIVDDAFAVEERMMARAVLHGKQLAYREAARLLRGKDRP